jgi:hypothetical protein
MHDRYECILMESKGAGLIDQQGSKINQRGQ